MVALEAHIMKVGLCVVATSAVARRAQLGVGAVGGLPGKQPMYISPSQEPCEGRAVSQPTDGETDDHNLSRDTASPCRGQASGIWLQVQCVVCSTKGLAPLPHWVLLAGWGGVGWWCTKAARGKGET